MSFPTWEDVMERGNKDWTSRSQSFVDKIDNMSLQAFKNRVDNLKGDMGDVITYPGAGLFDNKEIVMDIFGLRESGGVWAPPTKYSAVMTAAYLYDLRKTFGLFWYGKPRDGLIRCLLNFYLIVSADEEARVTYCKDNTRDNIHTEATCPVCSSSIMPPPSTLNATGTLPQPMLTLSGPLGHVIEYRGKKILLRERTYCSKYFEKPDRPTGTNLIMVKNLRKGGRADEVQGQTLAYMSIVQRAWKSKGQPSPFVYGLCTNVHESRFWRCDSEGMIVSSNLFDLSRLGMEQFYAHWNCIIQDTVETMLEDLTPQERITAGIDS